MNINTIYIFYNSGACGTLVLALAEGLRDLLAPYLVGIIYYGHGAQNSMI